MDTTGHADNEWGLRACGTWMLLHAASLFLAAEANAQSSNACDQLKGTLAARIEASGVRDYSLETVPATTPLPPGERVIGTCEGGRHKVVYRRGSARQPASEPAEAARPAPLPPAPAPAPAAAPAAPVAVLPVAAAPVSSVVPPAQPALQPVQDSAPATPWARRVSDFATANWQWLAALALLPLAGWLWAWRAHRNAYDKSGLPRGPRL